MLRTWHDPDQHVVELSLERRDMEAHVLRLRSPNREPIGGGEPVTHIYGINLRNGTGGGGPASSYAEALAGLRERATSYGIELPEAQPTLF